MNEVWTDAHWRGLYWRGLSVAVLAIGLFVASQAGGDNAGGAGVGCAALAQAQAHLRDLPTAADFQQADLQQATPDFGRVEAAASGAFDNAPAPCSAQTPRFSERDAQRALKQTVTMTTARVLDRNTTHAIAVAYARSNEP